MLRERLKFPKKEDWGSEAPNLPVSNRTPWDWSERRTPYWLRYAAQIGAIVAAMAALALLL